MEDVEKRRAKDREEGRCSPARHFMFQIGRREERKKEREVGLGAGFSGASATVIMNKE